MLAVVGGVMTTEANKAIVRRFFEDAWNRSQVSDLEQYIAADRIHHYGARVTREGVDVLRTVIRKLARRYARLPMLYRRHDR